MKFQSEMSESETRSANFPTTTSRRGARVRLYASLVLIDLLCIFASFFVAEQIYREGLVNDQWFIVAFAMAPIYLGAAINVQAFSARMLLDGDGVARALRAMLLAIGVLTFVAFYLKVGATFSRGTFAIGSIILLGAVSIARSRYLRYARRTMGLRPYNVVLISDADQPQLIGDFSVYLTADSWLDPESDNPQMFDQLAGALKNADRVVVSCKPERRLAWVRALKGANIRSEVVAPELTQLAPLGIDHWGDVPTMLVAEGPLSAVDRSAKRLFDIMVSGMLLIALSPLLLIVAILIKRESEGPVMFVQTRIGERNRHFRLLKFRSMRAESSDATGATSTSRADQRITRTGAWIRKTSVDELPQLINVLRGEMSIVGPRPHALGSRAADKLFWEVDGRYWHRHATKPGLTGLAQIRGFRGATEQESDLTDRLQADLEYLHDWSLLQDIMIILKTFRVLVHRNAF